MAGRGHPDGSKLGAEFSAEARRLWQLEFRYRNLTTLQALLVMNATSNGEGKDRLGWIYLTTAIRMSLDMQLGRQENPGSSSGTLSDDQEKMRRCRNVTAWGLFYWQKYVFHSVLYHPNQYASRSLL